MSSPFPSVTSDDGEVRIFNGHYRGLRSEPSQVLRDGSNQGPDWFGFSLSSRAESIIVGAPKGEEVTIFKLRPAVKVTLSTKDIPIKSIKYDEQKRL